MMRLMSTISEMCRAAASLTLSAVRPVEAGVALALAEDALAAARAALRAVATPHRPLVGGDNARHEGDLVGVAVVVVQREEPVARRKVVARRLGHRQLRRQYNSE